jgi:hypothetical protein
MKQQVRFDDTAGLHRLIESGFGNWAAPVTVGRDAVENYERAVATTAHCPAEPSTIPGLLLVSITPRLHPENNWEIVGHHSAINLGCSRIRFPATLPVGSTVRGRSRIEAIRPHRRGIVVGLAFEVHSEEPVAVGAECTVEVIYGGAQ